MPMLMAGKPTLRAELVGQAQARPIRAVEQLPLAVVAAAPDRPDGVEHPARRQVVRRPVATAVPVGVPSG